LPHVLRVAVAPGARRRIFNQHAFERNPVFFSGALDALAVAQENGLRDTIVNENRSGADDLRLFALGKDDALGRAHGPVDEATHDATRPSQPLLELFAIAFQVDELARNATGDRGPGNGWRDPEQHAWIERE